MTNIVAFTTLSDHVGPQLLQARQRIVTALDARSQGRTEVPALSAPDCRSRARDCPDGVCLARVKGRDAAAPVGGSDRADAVPQQDLSSTAVGANPMRHRALSRV